MLIFPIEFSAMLSLRSPLNRARVKNIHETDICEGHKSMRHPSLLKRLAIVYFKVVLQNEVISSSVSPVNSFRRIIDMIKEIFTLNCG